MCEEVCRKFSLAKMWCDLDATPKQYLVAGGLHDDKIRSIDRSVCLCYFHVRNGRALDLRPVQLQSLDHIPMSRFRAVQLSIQIVNTATKIGLFGQLLLQLSLLHDTVYGSRLGYFRPLPNQVRQGGGALGALPPAKIKSNPFGVTCVVSTTSHAAMEPIKTTDGHYYKF